MRKFIPGLIFMVIFIPSAIIYYQYDMRRIRKALELLNREFPAMSVNEELNGTVTNVVHGDPEIFNNNDPHHAYLILDDSVKRRIRAGYELTTELMLDEVLAKGDLILKQPGNYYFQLYKIEKGDTLKYKFEICDDLGYSLQSQK